MLKQLNRLVQYLVLFFTHKAINIYSSSLSHVDKKSREQFQTKIHKRMVDIINSTPKTVESLMKLDLPAGVDIEIKV